MYNSINWLQSDTFKVYNYSGSIPQTFIYTYMYQVRVTLVNLKRKVSLILKMRKSPEFTLHYIHGANRLMRKIYVPCTLARSPSSNTDVRKSLCTSTPEEGSVALLESACPTAPLPFLSPPSRLFPPSLASLQWSQQYCGETCQPLWSSHQGRREGGRGRGRGRVREGGIEKERERERENT